MKAPALLYLQPARRPYQDIDRHTPTNYAKLVKLLLDIKSRSASLKELMSKPHFFTLSVLEVMIEHKVDPSSTTRVQDSSPTESLGPKAHDQHLRLSFYLSLTL
jgi:hypothetical protein